MSQRYRGVVGKYINNYIYFHRKYLPLVFPDLVEIMKKFDSIQYNLLKISRNRNEVYLVNCIEFDSVPEPRVGTIIKVDMVYEKIGDPINYDYYVYHDKWKWVTDDYQGFDVEESKRRSLKWRQYNLDTTKIGHKKNWDKILEKYNNFED